ncbi:histidine phosphatase family protein [Halobacillus sp. ACCC02827]|uniref:histidine phosphatase family protein n=1 Tax=Halobacillus sp. ACCC02827 TaxID=3052090 RepID=UPI00257018A9|nr:histidine phosphatase family protein [Halobacillus sp. ACCC02827]WJE16923.1 histidine phosphatase family protein [Halobacillus sp. ACCC02827]
MEIALIRHGKSAWVNNEPITGEEFNDWVKGYDAAGVVVEKEYDFFLVRKVSGSACLFTSHRARAIESAKHLKARGTIIQDPLFDEVDLPEIEGPTWRQPPKWWLVALRILWRFGYTNNCESIDYARARAHKAAEVLSEAAAEHGDTVLVGHGIFNRLIARELRRDGWSGKRKASTEHWSCTIYTKEESG